jgi:hypothetical protein
MGGDGSFSNDAEIQLITHIISIFLEKGIDISSLGIICLCKIHALCFNHLA